MRRFFSVFSTAGTGASVGFAAHQFLALKEGQNIEDEFSLKAPLSAVVIGGLFGLLLGKRAVPAFLVAFVAALLLGRRLDEALPWAGGRGADT